MTKHDKHEDEEAAALAGEPDIWDAPDGAEKPVGAAPEGCLTPEQEAKITTPSGLTDAQVTGGYDAIEDFNKLSPEERSRLYRAHEQVANGERTRLGEMARSNGGYPGEIRELHAEFPELHPTLGPTVKPAGDPVARMFPLAADPKPPGSEEELGMQVVFAVPQGGASRSSPETRGGV